ncbi:hypothetical protein AGMMS50293_15570 [Spirochaetia bacterium]|nr:hypothetical protein AGMMS50293_15570 [Spirochaetia bacterium]
MINKNFYSRISLMLLAFGLIIAGQANAQTNSLNGTWVIGVGDYTQVGNLLEMTFNNGYFETILDGVSFTRGTYTVSGGKYTTQTTDVYGSYFKLESKFYSKAELIIGLKKILGTNYVLIEESIDDMFLPETGIFSINGNILTMKKDSETESVIYTKK